MAKKASQLLRYPKQRIDDTSDYMKISVVKYKPPGLGSSGASSIFEVAQGSNVNKTNQFNLLGTILLPVPEGLSDMNRTNWEGSNLNSLAAGGIDALSSTLDQLDLQSLMEDPMGTANAALGAIGNTAQGALRGLDQKTRDVIKGALIGSAVNVLGANVSLNDLTARQEGVILNPNLELLFKGVELRSFTFNFDMTPRSRAESLEIKAIINTFKKRMSAKTTVDGSLSGSKGIFIQSPDVFNIEFRSGRNKHPFLFSLKTCALTNIQVNYAGTGAYTTYDDATPVKMRMSLTFRELNPIYAEDYTDDLSEGVGF